MAHFGVVKDKECSECSVVTFKKLISGTSNGGYSKGGVEW
jgi:hypothetical protein